MPQRYSLRHLRNQRRFLRLRFSRDRLFCDERPPLAPVMKSASKKPNTKEPMNTTPLTSAKVINRTLSYR
jgi:hypothetical protein